MSSGTWWCAANLTAVPLASNTASLRRTKAAVSTSSRRAVTAIRSRASMPSTSTKATAQRGWPCAASASRRLPRSLLRTSHTNALLRRNLRHRLSSSARQGHHHHLVVDEPTVTTIVTQAMVMATTMMGVTTTMMKRKMTAMKMARTVKLIAVMRMRMTETTSSGTTAMSITTRTTMIVTATAAMTAATTA